MNCGLDKVTGRIEDRVFRDAGYPLADEECSIGADNMALQQGKLIVRLIEANAAT